MAFPSRRTEYNRNQYPLFVNSVIIIIGDIFYNRISHILPAAIAVKVKVTSMAPDGGVLRTNGAVWEFIFLYLLL